MAVVAHRAQQGMSAPLVGMVQSIQVAPPRQLFLLADRESTVVVQLSLRTDGPGTGSEQPALILYGGSTTGLRADMALIAYAMRIGSHRFQDGRGQTVAWPVYYAHYLAFPNESLADRAELPIAPSS